MLKVKPAFYWKLAYISGKNSVIKTIRLWLLKCYVFS